MGYNTEVSNIFHFGNFFAGRKYTALVSLFMGYFSSFIIKTVMMFIQIFCFGSFLQPSFFLAINNKV
tara:strand:- start:996 stop:1196 length:201 start_codon:yes stop_codon:yes gene_type:complete